MEEDQEICRVCRCESTLTKPLYHPCKCTGSIRFIHQDCLLEWLAHSRKNYCELCEHSFVFTPIYRQDMPARIPLYLLIGKCIQRGGASLKTGLRGLVVGIVWLVLLPYMILWSWRFCFSPSVNIDGGHSTETRRPSFDHNQHHSFDSSFSEYGVWEFLVDCFKGQVITMGLILTVAVAYIFREWMVQNIPLEGEQEFDTDQDIGAPLNKDDKDDDMDINVYQQYQHTHLDDDHNDTISTLTRQQTAVNALMEALYELDNGADTSAKGDGNDLKKQLEDLQNDLRQEIEKTKQSHHQEHHDRQEQQQQHHAHHQLDSNDTNTTSGGKGWMNNDNFQLNTDDDDETQVENMMQSIMVQDPAKASTRYSWDDLQKNTKNGQNRYNKQQHSTIYWKQDDSLASSSSLLSTPCNISPFCSTNDQLLDNIFISRSTVGNNSQYHRDQLKKPSISINLQQSSTPDSPSKASFTSSNRHHRTMNDIFSRSKLSPPHSPSNQQSSIFEKSDHTEANVTQQERGMENTQTISRYTGNQQNQHIDTTNDDDDDNVLDDDGIEDGIFNLGDDIDGVLEAIGMRGNLWVLLQNSILAFIIISCCLGVAVCIPYFIGRWVIMIRPLEKTIGFLQYVTDPLVDYALDRWLNPLMAVVATTTTTTDGQLHMAFLDLLIPSGVYLTLFQNNNSISSSSSHNNNGAPSSASTPWSLNDFQHSGKNNISSGNNGSTTSLLRPSSMINQQALATMNEWRNIIHAVSDKIIERWHQFAVGQSGMDRGICTIIGYLTLLCLGSWYLTLNQQRYRGRQHQQQNGFNNNMIIQQVGIFVKVVLFALLELALLPFFCGVLLEWVTLPLVVGGDASMKLPFSFSSSYWTWFLHWLVGTCFIYVTAVFISLCRATVRPGVFLFLHESIFQPIQDIMGRPLFDLLGKLCMSAMIYFTLIVGAIGSVIWAVNRYTGIQHLRLTFSEPLISVATDILAAQFLLPILVAYIKPRDSFKQTLSQWWHAIAHQLRLSSFMFGERYPLEERGIHVNNFTWNNSLPSFSLVTSDAPVSIPDKPAIGKGDDDTSAMELLSMDGKLARVPNQDTVQADPQQRMIIPVDPATLEPINPSEKSRSEPVTINDNTTVVYLPPHFKTRVVLFVISMWLCGSAIVCSLTVAPLLLGRWLLETWVAPGKQLHDLYSYVLGVCVVTLTTNAIRSVVRGAHYCLKQDDIGHDGLLIDLWDKLSACVRQKILNGCKLLYLIFMIGWLIPLLTGLAVDLYIFAPFRFNTLAVVAAPSSSQLALTTIITTLDLSSHHHWNSGLLYLGMIYRLMTILPTNTWQRTMNQYMVGGLSSLELWTLTRTILAPWIITTVSSIIIPGGTAWLILHLLAIQDIAMKLRIMQCVYFGVLSLVAILAVVILGMKLLNLWMRVVRDDTYLIGKQLHNLGDQGQGDNLNHSTIDGGINIHCMH